MTETNRKPYRTYFATTASDHASTTLDDSATWRRGVSSDGYESAL